MDNPETPASETGAPDDPDTETKLQGRSGGGDSGGGAYPNPHTGKDGRDNGGWMGHGGQTSMPYYGEGQLGDEKVGENANAPAEETGIDDD
jgi:hypothetical protein